MNDLHRHSFAKTLRKRFTDTERLLWKHLRAKQIEGYKFRRQEPIGSYIVDFVCQEKKIVIEVDGGQHSVERERDIARDRWLKEQGYKVLRFWNNEVLTNINGVLEVIRKTVEHPLPLPSREGNRSSGAPLQVGRFYYPLP
jgi:very-short-patch-repair endonuclease